MSNTGLKQKLMGSISAKITTSILTLLIIGFYIYFNIVNSSISEVDSKRDAVQEKSHKIQNELLANVERNGKEVLRLKKDNLRLNNQMLINKTKNEIDTLNKVVSAKLSSTAEAAYLMIESAMLEGNAPMVRAQMEILLELPDIIAINLWRAEKGHVGEASFRDNFTIKRVNKNLDDNSFKKRKTEKRITLDNQERKKVLTIALDTKANQTIDNSLNEKQVTFLYVPLLNRDECQICHGDDHEVRGVLEMAILREEIVALQQKTKESMDSLEKKQEIQFATLTETQKKEIQNINLQSENIKKEEESDRNEIANIKSKSARNRLLISILFIAALLVSLTWFLNKLIIKPLANTIQQIQEIENEGDLTKRLTTTSEDEFSELATWFNALVDKLEMTIGEISGNAHSLASSSKELYDVFGTMAKDADTMSSLAHNVANNSENMTSNISAVASAAEDVAENVNNVSTSARQMSENMTHITSTTEEVTANAITVAISIEEMSSTVSEISKNTIQAASISEEASQKAVDAQRLMQNLGNSAKSVGKVIGVINDIADRTNLLALNATIEAASAGEAGKGFAVVANEVKELAKQTAEATEKIVRQIEEMQENTNSAVKSIADITETINEINSINSTIAGAVEKQDATTNEFSKTTALTVQSLEDVKLSVEEAAKSAEEIAKSSQSLSSKVAEISSSAADTSKGANEVSSSIQTVSTSAERNSEGAQKISQSAGEMSSLSEKFQQLVNQFVISEEAKIRISSSGMQASHAPLMVWSDRFSVKIKEIDDQHKKLIDLINQLDSAMKDGKGTQVLGKILSGLIEYTGFHFQNEEKMMTKHNYPDYLKHKEEHDKLVKQAIAIQKDLDAGKAVVSIEVMDFLKDWLINHMMDTDKKYSPFFNKKGIH